MSELWDLAHGAHSPGSPVRDGKINIGYQGGNLRHVDVEEVERARLAGRGYSGPIACAIAGITYRQLDYWARTDLLKPSLSSAHGSGSRRLYSERDVKLLILIHQLLEIGVQLQTVRLMIESIRDNYPEPGWFIVFSAQNLSEFFVTQDAEEMISKIMISPCFVMVA